MCPGNFVLFISVQLTHDVTLVSGAQHRESTSLEVRQCSQVWLPSVTLQRYLSEIFFFFFNRGLRRERKDSARTFSANCVYYCCHFAHFSFLSVKLRKLKWFPKYLEVFGSQRLKTIADFGSMQFLPDLTHCWQYLEILSIFYLV